jgi:WD40 repeat protein
VNAVAFSPDGRWIASGGDDGYVRLWRGQRAAPPRYNLEPDAGAVLSAAFSADGKLLAAGGADGAVVVWNLPAAGAPDLRAVFKGHAGAVRWVAFSPDSRRLLSAGEDGRVCLWSASAAGTDPGRHKPELDWRPQPPEPAEPMRLPGGLVIGGSALGGAAFSPDGRTVAVLLGEGLGFWDVGPADRAASGAVGSNPAGALTRAAGAPPAPALRDFIRAAVSGPGRGLAFAPDASFVAVSGRDGHVVLWDAPGRP